LHHLPEAAMKLSFTDKTLRALVPPTERAQDFYFDEKTTGLQYVLGRGGTGTFYAVYYRAGAGGEREKRREVIGRYGNGPGEYTLPQAREALRAILGRVAEAKPTPGDLRRTASSGPTLAEAAADYLADMAKRGCRPSSIATVEREIASRDRGYVKGRLDLPLRSLTARVAMQIHDDVTFHHGKHVANRVNRNLHTIWECTARIQQREDPTWPANPFKVVTPHSGEQEGFVERRREPIAWSVLVAWKAAVDELSSVRRDYNLVVLLTGLRRTDACTLRWELVNTEDEARESKVWHLGKQIFQPVMLAPRSMLRPMPKGGASKAFTVPLSAALVEILARRRSENAELGADDGGWVFPSRAIKSKRCVPCAELGLGDHAAGGVVHMSEPKEDGDVLVSPHRLRDTFITACEEAGIPEGAAKVLVNHAWGKGDVTAGYRRQDLGFLADCQEKVTGFLLSKMVPPAAPTTRHLVSVA
jgi:hypothetical protein